MRRQSPVAEQCSILFITSGGDDEQLKGLRSIGFRVVETDDIPPSDVFRDHHAIILRVTPDCPLTVVATRLRAKPKFGRRALIALVNGATSPQDQRDAIASGFDITLPVTCSARDLAATVLRLLRPYPEYRCLLRAPSGRRKAA
jgi:hypothetical protein